MSKEGFRPLTRLSEDHIHAIKYVLRSFGVPKDIYHTIITNVQKGHMEDDMNAQSAVLGARYAYWQRGVKKHENNDEKYYYSCFTKMPHIPFVYAVKYFGKMWELDQMGERHVMLIEMNEHFQLTFQDVLDNPSFPWIPTYLCRNRNITIEDVRNHPEWKWDWLQLMRNRSINCLPYQLSHTWDEKAVEEAKEFIMKYGGVRMTIDEFRDSELWKPEYLNIISQCDDLLGITIPYFLAHPELKPHPYSLSDNPTLTMEHLLDPNGLFKDAKMTSELLWQELSKNPAFNIDVIIAYKEKPWSWRYICCYNTSVTVEDVLRDNGTNGIYIEENDMWRWCSQNPSTTFELVCKYEKEGKWCWFELARNPTYFKITPTDPDYVRELARIQNHDVQNATDPEYT